MCEHVELLKKFNAWRRAEIEGSLCDLGLHPEQIGQAIDYAIIELEQYKRRIQVMREALKPFAECVDQIEQDEGDEEWAKFRLLVKDYRAAYAALKQQHAAQGCGACGDGCEGQQCRVEAESPPCHSADKLETVKPELIKIGELIRTQDNRLTHAPIFCVMKKRPIVVDEDYDHDRIEWVNPDRDYQTASEHKARRLELLYEYGRDTDPWLRLAIKYVDEFVTACFTEQGCKEFLERDGHNHRGAFIYAFGSHRNAEYLAVREHLIALAKQAEVKP